MGNWQKGKKWLSYILWSKVKLHTFSKSYKTLTWFISLLCIFGFDTSGMGVQSFAWHRSCHCEWKIAPMSEIDAGPDFGVRCNQEKPVPDIGYKAFITFFLQRKGHSPIIHSYNKISCSVMFHFPTYHIWSTGEPFQCVIGNLLLPGIRGG